MITRRKPTTEEKFWSRVDKTSSPDGCWLWTGGRNGKYGVFADCGKKTAAHRWSYADVFGPIPEGLVVDHLCMVKPCVNPGHLEAVTVAENNARACKAGLRSKRMICVRGHAFTPENTRVNSRGHRQCLACEKERNAGRLKKLTVKDRFWAKVNKAPGSDGCWLWTGGCNDQGYGVFNGGGGKTMLAHRWSYKQVNGAIPIGLVLDHKCMVHNCVNPGHLEPVIQAENVRRAAEAGRYGSWHRDKTHCPRGHEYNEENSYFYLDGRQRVCRICQIAYQREYQRKRRAEDPEYRERKRQYHREYNREYRARKKAEGHIENPEQREKRLQYLREYHARKRLEDPDYYKSYARKKAGKERKRKRYAEDLEYREKVKARQREYDRKRRARKKAENAALA